jgi:hypothetical protein
LNINSGTAVSLEITDGTNFSSIAIALVQLDGTWSASFSSAELSGLAVGSGNITVTVLDDTGNIRSDIEAVTIGA